MRFAIVPFLICCLLSMSLFEYTLPREAMDRKSIEHFQKRATQQIVDSHAKLMKKRYGMKLDKEPEVFMKDKVTGVKVVYMCDKEIGIEEARKIHIDVTESLIAQFNNHKKYNRYMDKFPFKETEVSVILGYYRNDNGICYERPAVKLSYNRNDINEKDEKCNEMLYFLKDDKFSSHPSLKEKYEESKKIAYGDL